jgi:hypothetical protein
LELERALSRDLDLKVAELASRFDSAAQPSAHAQELEKSQALMVDGLRRDLAEATARFESAPRPDVIDDLRHDLAIANERARTRDERTHEMAGENAFQRAALDKMAGVVAERDLLRAETNRLKARELLVGAPIPAPEQPELRTGPATTEGGVPQPMVEESHKKQSRADRRKQRRSGSGRSRKR